MGASLTAGDEAQLQRDIALFHAGIVESEDPRTALEEFKATGLLARSYPEFVATWGALGEQDPCWHPEGNTFTHSGLVLDGIKGAPSEASRIIRRYGAAFHDIAKPLTFHCWPTTGGISHHGHAEAGANLFEHVIGPRLGLDPALISNIGTVIRYHMLMHKVQDSHHVSPQMLEFLLTRPIIEDMIAVQHADIMGTTRPLAERERDSNVEFMYRKLRERGRLT